ncbi:MAG: DUF4982 domain-containing protein, partial [Firmicutes bacterium]|nr:DUF4982 domain-containing protein [Bacillota bacterium]
DVFTSGDVVGLADDKGTISRKLAGRRNQRKASFEVAYKPGNLQAVAYYKGSEHAKATLSSIGTAKATKMVPDKKLLSLSKERDMVMVDITILDSNGQVVTFANREILLSVSEELQVFAIGNSAVKKTETIQMRQDEVAVQVVDGRARIAVIPLKEGKGFVGAFCEGLKKSKLQINVKA